MFITNLKRVMQAGFFSFMRNSFVSLSSVFVMVVTLSVIGSVIFGSAILNTTLDELKNKVDLNVYFVNKAQESDVLALKKTLEGLPEVEKTTYVSAADALANFKDKHQNDQFTLQALEELSDNPLGASLNVKTKEPSQYAGIAEFLKVKNVVGKDGTPIIDKVNYFQNKTAIDKLTQIIQSAEKLGLVVTLLFIAISILITFNTIRLVIYISRDEISVMRLVGAGALYVRGPFVIAGVLYGAAAGILTLVLFYPVTFWLGRYTANFFIGINIFSYYVSNFGQLFLVIIGSGIVIGAVSSYLAVHKYLKT
jgi:cell division transport system permease protein